MIKNILPVNTFIGKLSPYEIYDEFCGPKCFSVKNNFNQLYLVYWNGNVDGEATWLYSPVSEDELDNFIRKRISIRSLFIKKNHFTYYVTIGNKEHTCDVIDERFKKEVNYPPAGFILDYDELESFAKEAQWDIELKIAKKSASPDREVVTQLIDSISDLYHILMMKSNRDRPKLFPYSAKYGSFEIKFGTTDKDKAITATKKLSLILSDYSLTNDKLNELNVDPYLIKNIISLIVNNKLSVTIDNKVNTAIKDPIKINYDKISDLSKNLDKNTNVIIPSNKVPQANNINRIIKIVGMRINDEPLTLDTIDGLTSPRQIKYYIDSAACLGLLNKNLSVTPAGFILFYKKTEKARYEYLADRFESSACGLGWLKWANVDSITKLDEKTAGEFIDTCVKGLSKKTSSRRKSTLVTWLSLFKSYSRVYDEDSDEVKKPKIM